MIFSNKLNNVNERDRRGKLKPIFKIGMFELFAKH